ncbi:hypothetical protein NE237_007308 [Protea cynaroides]|uniref:PGG domain-containing protein n=1 Tax=Protea cynaroides TaxID=273540 RepID=A0A9Q0KP94_9MAGN|nr:hypothetical protein NE237_007308 [Protea cynaroides]
MHQSISWELRDDTLQSRSSHPRCMKGQMETKASSVEETPISMASEEALRETNPISLDDVPLLTREDYTIWKDKMEKFLKNYGLWSYFWSVLGILRIKCEATAQLYIKGPNTARHIWSQLITMYEFTHPTNTGMKMKSTRYTWCLPFYTAIVIGDWKNVSEFLSKNKGTLTAVLTSEGEVPLHVAVIKRQYNLAKKLIDSMSTEDLSRQNQNGRTALHIAASDGNIEIVKAIVEKDTKLVTIQSIIMCTPIMDAASAYEKNVVNYLYPITVSQEANRKEVYPGERERVRASLLNCFIWNDFHMLDVQDDAKNSCWHIRGDAENSFHTNRDGTQGNIMCGLRTSTNCIIFRFQKDIRLCFRMHIIIMPSNHDSFPNKKGKTPRLLFTEEHKELVKEGATWMKDTTTQCMVVATLITTIMFVAVFTVPGVGKEEIDHGYIRAKFPIMFVISNILAFCSSVASMLMFLAIITSRYAEEDFLSMGMMIAFVAAIFVMLPSQLLWVSFPITLLAAIPITLYALVELPYFYN